MKCRNKVEAAARRLKTDGNKGEAAARRLTDDGKRRAAASTLRQQAAASTLGSAFFNPFAEVEISRQNLPHWRQGEVWYFVTYRLADSLPADKLGAIEIEREQWLAVHSEPHTEEELLEYWERFGGRIQDLLDAGSGQCWLRRKDVRSIVVENLLFGAENLYILDSWVVMPNHAHVLFLPMDGAELSEILHTWKSYTAKRINRLLGRSGRLWQKESYDHIVRSPEALSKIREYIQENPRKAGLQPHEYDCA